MQSTTERIEQFKHFEESRRLLSNIIFIRSRIYWRELRKLQKERLFDSHFLLKYLKDKCLLQKELSLQWKDMEMKSRQTYQSQIKGLSRQQSLGLHTCTALIEMESNLLKISTEALSIFEKDVIIFFQEKLSRYETDLNLLWEEGKKLLIAWQLMDARVHYYYQQLIQALSTAGTAIASSEGDVWLCQMKYNESYRRYVQIDGICNNQFAALYQLAKQLELTRLNFTTRIMEKYFQQFQEAISLVAIQNKTASEKLASQVSLHGGQNGIKSFTDELNRRVYEDSVEKGNFETFATFELMRETSQEHGSNPNLLSLNRSNSGSMENLNAIASNNNNNSNNSTTHFQPNPNLSPFQQLSQLVSSLPNILSSMECKKLYWFFLEEPGMILTSWVPLMVVVTGNGWIHFFKLPETASTPPKQNKDSTGNIAQAYLSIVNSCKFPFEEDIMKPIDPSLSAAALTSKSVTLSSQASNASASVNTASTSKNNNKDAAKKVKFVNSQFGSACETVGFEEAEGTATTTTQSSGNQHEFISKILESLFPKDVFLEPFVSLALKNSTVVLKPNATPTESTVILTETTYYSSFTSFIFGDWSNERKFVLKAKNAHDLINFVTLFQ